MAAAKAGILLDILEEHVEEFSFLWQQRLKRLRSPDHTLPQLLELEDRIEAHVQGLLVAGDDLGPLMDAGLDADESLPVFLASYPLLRLGSQSAGKRVLDAFLKAEGGKLDGLRQALCYAGLPLLGALKSTVTAASAPVAIAAAEVLACHGKLEIEAADFDAFARHENPQVRRAAWRTAARTDIPKRAGAYPRPV